MNLLGIKILLATVLSASAVVVAQTTPVGSNFDPLIKELVSILGPLGFLGWYCWHVTARALPAKDQQIVAAQDKYQACLREELESHGALVTKLLGMLEQKTP